MSNLSQFFFFFFLAARRLMLTTTNSSWCPVVGLQGQVMSEVGGSRGWNRRQCPSPPREPGTTAASLGAPSDPLSVPLALHPPSGHQLQKKKNTPGVHTQRKTVSVCFLGCVFTPIRTSSNFSELQSFQEKTLAELQEERKPKARLLQRTPGSGISIPSWLALGSVLYKYQIQLQRQTEGNEPAGFSLWGEKTWNQAAPIGFPPQLHACPLEWASLLSTWYILFFNMIISTFLKK